MDANIETMPKVSVLLPVYNGEKHLHDAISSILSQTFTDLELLIINDGSTDGSEAIIRSFNDSRINYIINEKNIGLIATLNKGIELAKGEYLARMDADDISLPKRFETQVKLMNAEPDLVVCACRVETVDRKIFKVGQHWFTGDDIPALLLFNATICHPSVMMRVSKIKEANELYSAEFKHAEDYELWVRLALNNKFALTNEVLFLYRENDTQVSVKYKTEQGERASVIRKNYLLKCGFKFNDSEFRCHDLVGNSDKITQIQDLSAIEKWFENLFDQNRTLKRFNEHSLQNVLGKLWLDTCGNTNLGFNSYKYYNNSAIKTWYNISVSDRSKLFIKCIVR